MMPSSFGRSEPQSPAIATALRHLIEFFTIRIGKRIAPIQAGGESKAQRLGLIDRSLVQQNLSDATSGS
jgi:hypothetical protein